MGLFPPVAVIIPAAGCGRRMNGKVNKIWLTLGDRPLLQLVLELFQACQLVTELVLVVSQDELSAGQAFLDQYQPPGRKPLTLIGGGAERQHSVAQGLKFLENRGWGEGLRLVAIHDAARPLLTMELLEAALRAGQEFGAVGVAVPVKDTIKQVDSEGYILQTLPRSELWAIQTPQVFTFELIAACHQRVAVQGLTFSDDCGVVEYCGHRVRLIEGSYENIKITTAEDLILAENILRRRVDADRIRS